MLAAGSATVPRSLTPTACRPRGSSINAVPCRNTLSMLRRLVILVIAAFAGLVVPAAGGVSAEPTVALLATPSVGADLYIPVAGPPAAHSPPTFAERAVKLARTQLGVPYSYGGASPAGFDCSGLLMYVYGRLGVTLPHNAAALYEVGRPVPFEKLRPGDLVFFSGLGHVGMYVGDGKMIHAPQSGERVEIQALDERSLPPVGVRRVA